LATLASANRAFAGFGAWLAAVGGAWFAVGGILSPLWAGHGDIRLGQALGGTTRQIWEQLALQYGLCVVVVFLAAVALGRLAVTGVKDALLAAERDAAAEETPGSDSPATEVDLPVTGPKAPPWRETQSVASTAPLTAPTVGAADVRVAGTHEAGGRR